MTRNKIELSIAAIVIALPFLGLPMSYKNTILIVLGAALCVLALLAHIRTKSAALVRQQTDERPFEAVWPEKHNG